MTRTQIGQALEYAKPNEAIQKIHEKYADRLDPQSLLLSLGSESKNGDTTYTRNKNTYVYTLRGAMEICRLSRQPKADKFMDFVWDVMESLYNGDSVLAAPDQQTSVSNDTFIKLSFKNGT